jgi:hypothetical protein
MPVQDYAEEAINSNRNLALEVMFAVALLIRTKFFGVCEGNDCDVSLDFATQLPCRFSGRSLQRAAWVDSDRKDYPRFASVTPLSSGREATGVRTPNESGNHQKKYVQEKTWPDGLARRAHFFWAVGSAR